ncbi:MAG: phosphonate ABC transporter, permease protein PhnE [Hyphomicrobiales bacterium]|jgi:phosphonate transport system permease protein
MATTTVSAPVRTLSDLSQADITAARASNPDAFGNAGRSLLVYAVWAAVFVYLGFAFWYFDFARMFQPSENAQRLLAAMFRWQDMETWQYGNIYRGIAETLAMAFLGTFLASLVALVIGFLAARNIVRISIFRHTVRRILDVFRGVDQLVWALVFVRAVGLGPLAGVLAIFISDIGTLSKLYSEAIENIDRKEVEGIRATGGGQVRTIRFGILPQVFPVFLSQSLYFLESNTRSATILGIVGAGGIGMIIIERFRATLYDQVVFVVINVLILVAIIDWVSKKIRMKFIGDVSH